MMKNFKNLAFGLVTGALAFGFSAFTTAESSRTVAPFLVQSSSNVFQQRTGTEPGTGDCSGAAQTLHCYYETIPGQTLPPPQDESGYTDEEIQDLLDNNIIEPGTNSSTALYTCP